MLLCLVLCMLLVMVLCMLLCLVLCMLLCLVLCMVLVLVLGLFECLFAEAGAGEFEVVEVVWDWLSEEVVYVEFGYVL